MSTLTVDDAINKLIKLRDESPLGGNTCLELCLLDSELEFQPIKDFVLQQDSGALIEVQVEGGFLDHLGRELTTLQEQAEREVQRLKALGWKQEDFARELKNLLFENKTLFPEDK